MDIVTQNANQRHRMVKYCEQYGASKAAVRYERSRKTVYKWVNRYDGTLESLKDQSHRPHTSPKAHTEAELKLIRRELKRVKWADLLLAFQRLVQKGYSRKYGSFKRIVVKLRALKPSKAKAKKKPKPYTRADYPGQKIQIDVKYVPAKCVVNGKKYYQFTAIDECTR
jgi:transposase